MSEKIKLGLIMDPKQLILDIYCLAGVDEFIRALVHKFDCRLIRNQAEFDEYYDDVEALFSLEVEYEAPILDWRRDCFPFGRLTLAKYNLRLPYRKRRPKLSYMRCGDPYKKRLLWRQDYLLKNNITFLLAYYVPPTKTHFTKIPPDRIVSFPYIVPDEWITDESIKYSGQQKLLCFGASGHKAYNIRDWCRTLDFVTSSDYSGSQNKVLFGRQYFDWLKGFDAMIAAVSDSPIFDMTNPKYYEIAGAGCLLFAQYTTELEALGFRDMENCVIFDKSNFEEKAKKYLQDPESYIHIREKGRRMIRERHTVSVRLDFLEEHIRNHL